MIVLIRHGEAENAKGRAIGHTDLPLSETGKIQAGMLAENLGETTFKTFLASPLTRTMQTASFITAANGMTPAPCPEFKEINLGQWDGLSYEKIKADFPDEYRKRGLDIAGYRPPEGENFLDLKNRVAPALKAITEEQSPTIIITHAGVIRVIMHLILDFPMENIFRIKPGHCYASLIQKSPRGYSLKGYNIPPGPELSYVLAKTMS